MIAGNPEPIEYLKEYNVVTDPLTQVTMLNACNAILRIKGSSYDVNFRLGVSAASYNQGDTFIIASPNTILGASPIDLGGVDHQIVWDGTGFDYNTLDCSLTLDGNNGNLKATFTANRTFGGASYGNFKYSDRLVKGIS